MFRAEEDPSKFWDRVIGLGNKASAYTNALLSQVTRKIPSTKSSVLALQSTISTTITSPGLQAFRSELQNLTLQGFDDLNSDMQRNGLDLSNWSNTFSFDLSCELELIMDQFRADFPEPSTAPNHAQRVVFIQTLMNRIEEGLVRVSAKYGVREQDTKDNFSKVRHGTEDTLIIVGDLVEQHPILLEALVFSTVILFLPKVWLTRPILSCFGFGPSGPIKGSTAAWAQRRFFGAVVTRGSWFARLQQAGMRGWGLYRLPEIVLGAIGGGLMWGIGRCF
ncbi:hypothetical protein VKT23_010493 [Stygiomarasmius scandens]|uniref:Uncharacterized protein n=1 Tax=Marasmiellus scandens TaxID=2682957 RepID=A0ABR1JEC7_9AGAR